MLRSLVGSEMCIRDRYWYDQVKALSGFNRYTYGTGIAAAEKYIIEQLYTINPSLDISVAPFNVNQRTGYNIIAKMTGTTTPNDWYIVGAHYDSISQSPTSAAPGAEDNGSGSAAVMEILRIFTAYPPPSTILFIWYSGEEQGLFGSKAHVNSLIQSGNGPKLKLALIMDMIGFTANSRVKALVETYDKFSADVAIFTSSAATYVPRLQMFTSYSPFGSDHMPYLTNGFKSVLVIENDYDKYPAYHRTTDTISYISIDQGKAILELNVAVLARYLGFK
eukprot:TRINITY_DN2882_c0_g1_i1.p1 TRINITY_DN2882_c0_g1~~TRINITY_DN2882_c0_g1_i1.p1  ORF type:complete len:278 (-),score=52.51 TRINITY_DN2882_c0_g1_i1:58-891(-)